METVWMNTARLLSQRSRCKRNSVGCVVTDSGLRRVLGNGYNGRAADQDECPGTDPCCLHSEINALITSGSIEKDKVMFVTVLPCEKCAMAIVNSGFSRVVYDRSHEKKEGLAVLKAAGIEVQRCLSINT